MNALEEQSLIARMVKLRQEGKAVYVCAKELGITRYAAEKLVGSDEYKAYLAQVAKDIESEIIAFEKEKHRQLSAKLWALEAKIVKTIERNLDEGKIQAVDTWAKLAITKEKIEDKPQDSKINIIMPGANEPPVIEVKSAEVQDGSDTD